jgi:hypothetical protein
MLLLVLALFWVALLTPIVVRRFRDGGTEKSILSFHAEHEVLSRQDYAVAPAHRLDRPDQPSMQPIENEHRPRLTVVQPDDTVGTLESRSTWDEWSEDYDYDGSERPPTPTPNRYARAYASRPSEPEMTSRYAPPLRRRGMRAQRRVMFVRCVAAAVVFSLVAYLTKSSIALDVAVLAWFAVVLFVALALYAVGEGYLEETSLPLRVPAIHVPTIRVPLHLPQRRTFASVQPLYLEHTGEYAAEDDDEFVSEFYDPETDEPWRRESQGQRAFG